MSPRTVHGLMSESVKTGVKEGVQEEVQRHLRPSASRKVGFVVGALILTVGHRLRARRNRMHKIERKLDVIVEQVADDADDRPVPADRSLS